MKEYKFSFLKKIVTNSVDFKFLTVQYFLSTLFFYIFSLLYLPYLFLTLNDTGNFAYNYYC